MAVCVSVCLSAQSSGGDASETASPRGSLEMASDSRLESPAEHFKAANKSNEQEGQEAVSAYPVAGMHPSAPKNLDGA
eukprot:scaffold673543_cov39-Prasinocladus_malaysianus.AAC.1